MRKHFSSVLVSANVVALAIAAPAYAQDTDSDAGGLEEIVVTAQKREQSLQDIPVAVTAVTADALKVNRVENITDLTGLVPGLNARVNAGGLGSPSLAMRGVVASASAASADRQISNYLDGVYIGGIRGSVFDIPETERIEVLRGPQGTLFGRNATAGAVNVITRDPKGELSVRQEFTVGNFGQFRSLTSIDLPQVGPFSAFFTYRHDERRGDVKNLGAGTTFDRTSPFVGIGRQSSPKTLGAKNNENIFAAVKFEPSDVFKMTYKFDWMRGVNSQEARTVTAINPNDTVGQMLIGVLAGQPAGGGRYGPVSLNPNDRRPGATNNAWTQQGYLRVQGHNLTTDFQVSDSLSLKNITAYRKAQVYGPATIAGLSGLELSAGAIPAYARFAAISRLGAAFFALSPDAQAATVGQFAAGLQPLQGTYLAGYEGNGYGDGEQFSNELQANYNSAAFDLTAGALYYWAKETAGGTPGMAANFAFAPVPELIPLGAIVNSGARTRSIAAYAQADIHLTPQFDLQVGGRVTRDKKRTFLEQGGTFTGNRFGEGTITGITTIRGSFSVTKATYSVALNYKPDDNTLIYAKTATGFLSGGSVGDLAFNPETVTSYEAGVKSDLLDRRLRINLALWQAKYKGLQQSQSGSGVVPPRPELGVVVTNSGTLRARGVELEVTAQPVEGLTLGGQLGFTDQKLLSFNPALLAFKAQGQTNYALGGTPRWTGSLNAQYVTQPVIGDATMLFRVDANYTGKIRAIVDPEIEQHVPVFAPYEFNPSRWIINSRIALRDFEIDGWKTEISVWGRNLTNVRKPMFGFPFGTILYTNSYQTARTYGVDFSIQF